MERIDWRLLLGAAAIAALVIALAVFRGSDSSVVVSGGALGPCCDDTAASPVGEDLGDPPEELAFAADEVAQTDDTGTDSEPCSDDETGDDIDADGIVDECDDDLTDGPSADADGDGVANAADNCVSDENADQSDADADGTGDVCDPDGPQADLDGDGVANAADNCLNVDNGEQSDVDEDGAGDACDPDPADGPAGDADGDGVSNATDNCIAEANPQQNDQDADGIGNACDSTDDREPEASAPDASDDPPADNSGDAEAPGPETDNGSDNETPRPEADNGNDNSSGDNQPVRDGAACILYLHGAGTPPPSNFESWSEGIEFLQPHSGNPEQPWFWLYDGPHNLANDPGDSNQPYNDLVAYLTQTLDDYDCGPTMLYGASNGGGFAARLYCSGEDFDGRVWGVFVDDPVPDAGVIGCSPSPNVQRSLFVHSTEVVTEAAAFVDNRCSQSPTLQWPWYCQDDIGFDLEEYESHIGQESVWGRENHIGPNLEEVSFWKQVLSWWYDYDPVAFSHLEGR